MNIMRKLRSGNTVTGSGGNVNVGTGHSGSASAGVAGIGVGSSGGHSPSSGIGSDISSDTSTDSTHNQLGLMHLKKLFNEYTHPKEALNENERDFKLYNMLPLFCKVNILLKFRI